NSPDQALAQVLRQRCRHLQPRCSTTASNQNPRVCASRKCSKITKAAVEAGYGATIAALNANAGIGWAADAVNAGGIIDAANDNGAAMRAALEICMTRSDTQAAAAAGLQYGAIATLRDTSLQALDANNAAAARMLDVRDESRRSVDVLGTVSSGVGSINLTLQGSVLDTLKSINSAVGAVNSTLQGGIDTRGGGSQLPIVTRYDEGSHTWRAEYASVDLGSNWDPNKKFALGGAFDRGRLLKHAMGDAYTNSIVSSPTFFGSADGRMNVMGEAGPEAIMPLTRAADGSLGVRAVLPPPVMIGGAPSDSDPSAPEIRFLRKEVASLREALVEVGRAQLGEAQRIAEGVERGADASESSASTARSQMMRAKAA
ncbi:phage tail tape measure protein, partial [Roseomonas indoligenes]